jgi:hypothetical protein
MWSLVHRPYTQESESDTLLEPDITAELRLAGLTMPANPAVITHRQGGNFP